MTGKSVPHCVSQSPATSLTLIARAIEQDQAAWERIVFLYSPLVSNWCRRKQLREEEIQDVGQEVFKSLYMNLHKFQRNNEGDSFRKWLKTITVNKANDLLRKKLSLPVANVVVDSLSNYEEISVDEPDDQEALECERVILMRRCLEIVKSEFESRTFQAFWELVVNNKSPAEVSSLLSPMTVGAVHTAKSRIKKRLGELLEQLETDFR